VLSAPYCVVALLTSDGAIAWAGAAHSVRATVALRRALGRAWRTLGGVTVQWYRIHGCPSYEIA
jgi:hypothetical protein